MVKRMLIERLPKNVIRMARAVDEDVETLRRFLTELEGRIWGDEEERCSHHDLAEWVEITFYDVVPRWQRVVEGYVVLRDTCADPGLSYLEWKPELIALSDAFKALLEAAEFSLSVLKANRPVEASEFLAIEKLAAAIDQAEAADDQS